MYNARDIRVYRVCSVHCIYAYTHAIDYMLHKTIQGTHIIGLGVEIRRKISHIAGVELVTYTVYNTELQPLSYSSLCLHAFQWCST